MILQIFSIYDSKSKTYNPPFYQKNVGEATRTFTKIVADKSSLIGQFPEDFSLVLIGDFDDESAEILARNVQIIGTASQYTKD